jgi:ATP adenylyltransferase
MERCRRTNAARPLLRRLAADRNRGEIIEQDRIQFLVRVATNLRRKDAARAQQAEASRAAGKPVNPFRPHEQDLFVADISTTHFCR